MGLFAKKTSSSRTNTHNIHNVEFVNTFKTFKSKNARQGVISDQLETVKEDCRSKVAYFSERYSRLTRFVELVTGNIRGNKFSLIDNLQRILKNVLKRKALSLLESVMTNNHEAWFFLLMVTEPTSSELADFYRLVDRWAELDGRPIKYEEMVDDFVKGILQNKKLNEEICKLVIYITSRNV